MGVCEYRFPGAVGPQAKERVARSPASRSGYGRNVMMIEALDDVSWSPTYACPFSETRPRKSENAGTNSTTATPARRALWPLEAAAS